MHAHVQSFFQTLALMCFLVSFLTPKKQCLTSKCWNDPKQRERSERANILYLFEFVCHVCCVSWWKLDLFIVTFDVCVRYNRIFACWVPTHCVLRTVWNKLNIAPSLIYCLVRLILQAHTLVNLKKNNGVRDSALCAYILVVFILLT